MDSTSSTSHIRWASSVTTVDPLDSLPRLIRISEEYQSLKPYYWDGATRDSIDHILFKYTLSGVGWLRDANGTHRLDPETAFLCRICDSSICYWREPNHAWQFLYCTFRGPAAFAIYEEWARRHRSIVHIPLAHPTIRHLQDMKKNPHPTWSSGQSMMLFGELLHTAEQQGIKQNPKQAGSERCRQCISLMSKHLNGSLSIADCAKQIGITREALTRDFQKHFDESPAKAYLRMRIEAAAQELISSNKNQEDIAQLYGWPSAAHLSRVFKRCTGMTPGTCRRNGDIPFML